MLTVSSCGCIVQYFIQKLKLEFHESAKDRDALIEAGCQLSGPDANDAQQNVHSICQRYVTVHSLKTLLACSLLSMFLSFSFAVLPSRISYEKRLLIVLSSL